MSIAENGKAYAGLVVKNQSVQALRFTARPSQEGAVRVVGASLSGCPIDWCSMNPIQVSHPSELTAASLLSGIGGRATRGSLETQQGRQIWGRIWDAALPVLHAGHPICPNDTCCAEY